jgi:tetratricopeptide (TPR) repeat protein
LILSGPIPASAQLSNDSLGYNLQYINQIGQKSAFISNWAQNALFELNSENTDSSISPYQLRGFFKILDSLNFKKDLNVEKLTDFNEFYWKARMVVPPINPIIPVCKALLFAVNNEFDKAANLAPIIRIFASADYTATWRYIHLDSLIYSFNNELDTYLELGVRQFDLGKPEIARKIFIAILDQYPNSPWANHELLLTNITLKKDENFINTVYYDYREKVYGNDPFYPYDMNPKSADDRYKLYRRKKKGELFRNRSKGVIDFIEYGNIALELEEYGLAAEVFHNSLYFSSISDSVKTNSILPRFYFCMKHLGLEKKIFREDVSFSDELKEMFEDMERRKKVDPEELIKYMYDF